MHAHAARDAEKSEAPRAAPPLSQLWSTTPWLELAASPPFLSICAAHFSHNWGQYLLLSWIPKYLTHLGLTLDKGGVLYALPFICAGILDNAAAWIADELLLQRSPPRVDHTPSTWSAVAGWWGMIVDELSCDSPSAKLDCEGTSHGRVAQMLWSACGSPDLGTMGQAE